MKNRFLVYDSTGEFSKFIEEQYSIENLVYSCTDRMLIESIDYSSYDIFFIIINEPSEFFIFFKLLNKPDCILFLGTCLEKVSKEFKISSRINYLNLSLDREKLSEIINSKIYT